MIKYALHCDQEHGFESWFPSSASYDTQVRRALVGCPVCGSTKISKQIMSPSVRLKSAAVPSQESPSDSGQASATPAQSLAVSVPEVLPQLMSEPMQQLRAMVKEFHAHVQANTEDVGSKFAEEAQKIHYGETEDRPIRGKATADEIEILHDEGIPFMPLPTLPEDRN
jgi:hypothetical protein